MKWTYDLVNRESEQVLGLLPREIKVLADVIKIAKIEEKLAKSLEKYQDIHDIGEATGKIEDKLLDIEDKLGIVRDFLKQGKIKFFYK